MIKKETKSRVWIDVTEKDAERGTRENSSICAVAVAIARTVSDATRIEVDTQTIRFTTQGERRVYLTPAAVQGYVIAFDAGDDIGPFRFQLRDPVRARRRIQTELGKQLQGEYDQRRRHPKVAGKGLPATPQKGDKGLSTSKKDRTSAIETNPGAVRVSDRGGRTPPPRVFKTKRRVYGHRVLRINQQSA
jgi:hypothetical protein